MSPPKQWLGSVSEVFERTPLAAAAGTIGEVALIVGLLLRLLVPSIASTGTLLVWAGLVFLLIAGLDAVRQARSIAGRRRRRYGVNVVAMSVIFLGLIVLVNVLAFLAAPRFDLTASRHFTLAPQTEEVLDGLDQNIEATAFFVDRFEGANPDITALRNRTDNLLRAFHRESDGRVSYRFVDPETDPLTAADKGVRQYPVVVFESETTGERYQVPASSNFEQAFLTALLVTTGQGQKTIYVTTGHGELAVDDAGVQSPRGFAAAVDGLRDDGYRVEALNLSSAGEVPAEAAAVVVPSPRNPLPPADAEAIDAYLQQGGRVMLMLEPESHDSWGAWAARWGITVGEGYVIDLGSNVAGTPNRPLLTPSQYAAPYITAGLDASVFPGLAPIGLIADPTSIPNLVDYDDIGLTTPVSFASLDLTAMEPNEDDPRGPFRVGVIVRSVAPVDEPPPAPENARLATLTVFGDGEFASNRFFPALSNGDLFLNTVNDLAGDVPLVPVRSKPLEFRGFVLNAQQFTLVRLLGWLALPLAMVAVAIGVWLRRRYA